MRASKKPPGTRHNATVGDRIRESYVSKGWTRKAFERALGCDYAQIIKWERGDAMPRLDTLKQIAAVTGVTVAYLLEGDAEMTEPQYLEWASFVQTDEGRKMTAEERTILGSMHFPDRPPTQATYRALLLALRLSR